MRAKRLRHRRLRRGVCGSHGTRGGAYRRSQRLITLGPGFPMTSRPLAGSPMAHASMVASAPEILDRYARGLSWKRSAEELTALGLWTPSGRRWSEKSVAVLVRELLGPDANPPAWRNWGTRRAEEVPGYRRERLAATRARGGEPAREHLGGPEPTVQIRAVSREQLPPECAEYVRWRVTTKSRGTAAHDVQVLRRLVGHVGADHFWDRLDEAAVASYQRVLAAVLPHPSTRAGELSGVRVFLRYAFDEGWLAADLSRRITLPHVPERDPRPIPASLVRGMLAALPRDTRNDLQVCALVHFMISTGCRISEGLSVDRADLTAADEIRVRGLKGSGMRTVLLLPAARAAVDEYLAGRGEDRCPALFVSYLDVPGLRRRMTPDVAAGSLKRLRRRLRSDPGMAYFTSWHVARHTLATALLEVTRDARLVAEVLGHRSMETLRIYTQISDPRKRDVYAPGGKFAGLLDGSPAGVARLVRS